MDRKQAPVDNVWVPSTVEVHTAVGLIAEYFMEHDPKGYPGRALIVHTKSDVSLFENELADFAANGNIGSPRGKGGERGGPVLAHDPDLGLLEHAIKIADGQLLGVTEQPSYPLEGWAAATRALDLSTRERHPGVPDEIHETLMDLKREGNNGYPTPKKNSAYTTMVNLYIGKLKTDGYEGNFVASYLLGSGINSHAAHNLRKIYR